MAAQAGDLTTQQGLASCAQAKLPPHVPSDVFVRGTAHHSQSLPSSAVGEHVQEGRLAQGNAKCRLQRVVEYRITRAVGKIDENDGVLIGQALALLMQTIETPAPHEKANTKTG